MTTLELLIVVTLVMSVSSLLQASAGFGQALVAAPILALINPEFVPAAMLFAALFLTSYMALKGWQHVNRKWLGYVFIGILTGSVVGALWVNIGWSIEQLSIVIALSLLIAVGVSFLGWQFKVTNRNLFWTGVISGFINTLSGAGGPPLALLFQHLSPEKIRATLATIFFIGALSSLASLAMVGRFTLLHVELGFMLLPGTLIGLYLSRFTVPYLDKAHTRVVLLVVSAVGAVALLVRYL